MTDEEGKIISTSGEVVSSNSGEARSLTSSTNSERFKNSDGFPPQVQVGNKNLP
jgi:hypothetical protein